MPKKNHILDAANLKTLGSQKFLFFLNVFSRPLTFVVAVGRIASFFPIISIRSTVQHPDRVRKSPGLRQNVLDEERRRADGAALLQRTVPPELGVRRRGGMLREIPLLRPGESRAGRQRWEERAGEEAGAAGGRKLHGDREEVQVLSGVSD